MNQGRGGQGGRSGPRRDEPDDQDIRRDQAAEERHRQWLVEGGRWQKKVPMRHWTAGSWAQLILAGIYGVGSFEAIRRLTGAEGMLLLGVMVLSFVVGVLSAVITWENLGEKKRNIARKLVKAIPVLIVGVAIAAALIQKGGLFTPKTISGPGWQIPTQGSKAKGVPYGEAEATCTALGPGWRLAGESDIIPFVSTLSDHRRDFWLKRPESGGQLLYLDVDSSKKYGKAVVGRTSPTARSLRPVICVAQ